MVISSFEARRRLRFAFRSSRKRCCFFAWIAFAIVIVVVADEDFSVK